MTRVFFYKKYAKMGPIVIHDHVNIIGTEFKLDQQKLDEFVHPGHKGLTRDNCGLSACLQSVFYTDILFSSIEHSDRMELYNFFFL